LPAALRLLLFLPFVKTAYGSYRSGFGGALFCFWSPLGFFTKGLRWFDKCQFVDHSKSLILLLSLRPLSLILRFEGVQAVCSGPGGPCSASACCPAEIQVHIVENLDLGSCEASLVPAETLATHYRRPSLHSRLDRHRDPWRRKRLLQGCENPTGVWPLPS
jgi:hypothetical protein